MQKRVSFQYNGVENEEHRQRNIGLNKVDKKRMHGVSV